MKKLNKKGFTLVELVIVIAVIAILAAVLIPTFSTVIEKANKNAAVQSAKNAYTTYVAEVAETGEYKANMWILAKGYYVEVKDNAIVPDSAQTATPSTCSGDEIFKTEATTPGASGEDAEYKKIESGATYETGRKYYTKSEYCKETVNEETFDSKKASLYYATTSGSETTYTNVPVDCEFKDYAEYYVKETTYTQDTSVKDASSFEIAKSKDLYIMTKAAVAPGESTPNNTPYVTGVRFFKVVGDDK